MALPTDIRPASFRGVAFEAREMGFSTGRRAIVNEYPQGETGAGVEDNGRATRRWRLQAFLVGDGPDVRARKQELIAACETHGPGTLIHPTDGSLWVQIEAPTEVMESSSGVNYVEFSLLFVESHTYILPRSVPPRTLTIGDQLRAAVRAFYAARLLVRGVTRKVDRLLTGTVEDRLLAVIGLGGILAGVDVAAFVYAVQVMADTYETSVDDGEELASTWQAAVDLLGDTSGLRKVTDTLGVLFAASTAAYVAGADTEADEDVLTNTYQTDLMFYSSALARASETAANDSYAAYEDAQTVSTDLADRLADLDGHYGDDPDAYAALVDLRSALTASILDTAIDLPRLRTLSVVQPTLALALAHALYGDATRAGEIIERNGIDDPNAVTGDILVLTE